MNHRRAMLLLLLILTPAGLASCRSYTASVPQAGSNLDTYPAEVRQRILEVENEITSPVVIRGTTHSATLAERMAHYRVPGVSLAVVQQGEIDWARGYGMLRAGRARPVTSETRFQAASISKPVSAAVALHLVDRGALDLDEDVNVKLRSWQVPPNDHNREQKVNLRRLLSHTAGLTVHGFAGYLPGERLPTLTQILDGRPPANSDPVRVDLRPGTELRYSGGGYIVLEQLLEDVTSSSFPALARQVLLEPLGMTRSTYETLTLDESTDVAWGHTARGRVVQGQFHVYPEHAAASLWTTPTDLARFAIEIMRSLDGSSKRVLSQETAANMLTVQAKPFALGWVVGGADDTFEFSHGGSNVGFRCQMLALPTRGQAVVVMTNGDRGADLASEIIATVARVYDWPSHKPRERATIDVDPGLLRDCVGRYSTEIGVEVELSRRGDQLFLAVAGEPPEQLHFASPEKLFILSQDVELTFERDAAGRIRELTLETPQYAVRGKKL